MAGMEIHDSRTTVAGGRERRTPSHEKSSMSKDSWVQRLLKAVWSSKLLALLVTSRRWNSRIHYRQVKLSQLRLPELQLWSTNPRSGSEIDKNLIVINGDILENLEPETMCPAWLYEEMARADTLLCGSQTVVDNMYDVLETETERRLNDDFNAPGMANMVRIPMFSWPTKPKAARDSTLFDVCWLLISSPDSWMKKVKFRNCVVSLREASRNNFSLFADSELSDVWTYSSTGDG